MLKIQRFIHLTPVTLIKKYQLPPRPKFSIEMENECEEKFLHGGRGPGGQKINKCNSKVQLKHLPSNIVVECQETRFRERNRSIAREKMALKIAQWLNQDQPTEREIALHKWERQNKRSKERKSRNKHKLLKETKREAQLKQLEEEEKLIKQIIET